MAKNNMVQTAAIALIGFAVYSMGQQEGAPLGQTIYNMTKAIQRMIHGQTAEPGTDSSTGSSGGSGTPAGEVCPPPGFSTGNYVAKKASGDTFVYEVVRNGQLVARYSAQSDAEKYYNWSYCPSQHAHPGSHG